ncbi:MAG: tetratricopeptide repeat protein [Planctomycetota bacterium]
MLDFARDRFDQGEAREALRVAESVLGEDPDNVMALRLRQDVLRERGRRGRLRSEAEERVHDAPNDPLGFYLRGRLQPAGRAQTADFERCTHLGPDFFWGWLGLGWSLRRNDPTRAVAIFERLHALEPRSPLVCINLASTLLQQERPADAAAVYARLRAIPGAEAVADLGLARVHLHRDGRLEAWAPLLSALRARPYDGGVRGLLEGYLRAGLSVDRLEQVREVLYQEPERLATFVRAGGDRILAEVFSRLGAPHLAREALSYDGQPPAAPQVRRAWRRAALATGDVHTYLADLRASFPRQLLDDERNQVRGRWISVLHGAWTEAQDPLADTTQVRQLVVALRDAGLLDEADAVATFGIVRSGDSAALRELRDEIRRAVGFEAAVRRVLYAGYLTPKPATLEQTFAEVRRVALEILGEDVVGSPRVFSIPFVGSLIDPFGDGLPKYFARYNKHLVLGQRLGMPVEGMLLTRLSVRDLADEVQVPVPVRAREVVGEDRSIQARTSLVGGDIAGVALIDNFVVDMDAVRDWAGSLLRMRRIGREDGAALLHDAVPPAVDALEPLDAEWRLAMLSPVEDSAVEAAVLDVIRWHERAHLADTFYYLPPEANLWRVGALLLRNAFSATSVEADLEARAELVALAKSPHTRLVLAHIAGFCGQQFDGFSAHASGFERLARALQRRWVAAGAAETAVAVSRWHELDPEQVRRTAQALLDNLW